MADFSAQQEVNEAILDFLVYDAIKAIISNNDGEDQPAKIDGLTVSDHDQHLDLVDSFISIFKSIHPGAQCSPLLRLRLRLLKFTVLFTKRQTRSQARGWGPQIQLLRQQRQKDAKFFNSHAGAMDFTQYVGALSPLEQRRQSEGGESETKNLELDPDDANLPIVSLLDMVPFFMALSATEIVLHAGSQITPMWMRLAAGFITQAVIEQCLVYGCRRQEVFDEAFAWGFDPDATFEEGTDGFAVNAMFFDDSGEFPEWAKIKQEHMSALIPPPGEDLLDHLEGMKNGALSLDDFKRRMLAFIEGMSQSIPPPSLSQQRDLT